jgi:predicted nucleic acid-binding protein
VKLYINEDRSDVLRKYFHAESTKYTTPFCYFEALNVLKAKRFFRNAITEDEYHKATFDLTAGFGASSTNLPDIKLTDPIVISEVLALSKKHSLDLSDSFQIMSVKKGYFSVLIGDSKTILVTADAGLANAARSEQIRVWNLMTEPPPN